MMAASAARDGSARSRLMSKADRRVTLCVASVRARRSASTSRRNLVPWPPSSARVPPRPRPRRPHRTAAPGADKTPRPAGWHRRAIDQKPDGLAPSRVKVVDREQYRLLASVCLALGTMRQKAVVAVGPQMRVERIDTIFGGSLHDHSPAALERALEQIWQHLLDRLLLEVIEQDLSHGRRIPDRLHDCSMTQ